MNVGDNAHNPANAAFAALLSGPEIACYESEAGAGGGTGVPVAAVSLAACAFTASAAACIWASVGVRLFSSVTAASSLVVSAVTADVRLSMAAIIVFCVLSNSLIFALKPRTSRANSVCASLSIVSIVSIVSIRAPMRTPGRRGKLKPPTQIVYGFLANPGGAAGGAGSS